MRAIDLLHYYLLRESFGRTSGQLLGHHMTWVNPIIGLFLLLGPNTFYLSEYFGRSFGSIAVLRIIIAVLTISGPTIFYFFGKVIEERNQRTENSTGLSHMGWSKRFAAMLATALLVIFYSTFGGYSIIKLMIFQHIGFGIFLQFATHAKISTLNERKQNHEKA